MHISHEKHQKQGLAFICSLDAFLRSTRVLNRDPAIIVINIPLTSQKLFIKSVHQSETRPILGNQFAKRRVCWSQSRLGISLVNATDYNFTQQDLLKSIYSLKSVSKARPISGDVFELNNRSVLCTILKGFIQNILGLLKN